MTSTDPDGFMTTTSDHTGTFARWNTPGEETFGIVLAVDLDGGTSFDGSPAPRLVIQPCRRTGTDWLTVEYTGDDNVLINGGPTSLQSLIREHAADFQPGYLVRIVYLEDRTTKTGGRTYKAFQHGSSRGKAVTVTGSTDPEPERTPPPADGFDF